LIKDAAVRVLQRGSRCWMSLPGQQKLEEVLAAIRQAGGKLVSVIPHKATLEELFLEHTNQGV
jgi:ABC-2 type transport system ATP-binding protein